MRNNSKTKKEKDYRENQRAMMLYVDANVYEALRSTALALRPPSKPGPLAAEILRQHLEREGNFNNVRTSTLEAGT